MLAAQRHPKLPIAARLLVPGSVHSLFLCDELVAGWLVVTIPLIALYLVDFFLLSYSYSVWYDTVSPTGGFLQPDLHHQEW